MFNKSVNLMIIIFVLLLLISGCAGNEEQGSNRSEEKVAAGKEEEITAYFPLLEGKHYEYQGEGIEYASFVRDILYIDSPFVQVHEDNGGTVVASVYKVEEEQVSLVKREAEYYSEENLIPKLKEQEELKVEEVIIKNPLEEGTTWETNGKTKEIVEIDTELEVPAGKFYDVIKIKSETDEADNDMTHYHYYAKNIGLIKQRSAGEDYEILSELESYEKPSPDTD